MSKGKIHGGALLWLLAISAAEAGPVRVTLQVAEDLPFSREQLAAALELRGVETRPPRADVPRVLVRASGPAAVEIRCDHKRRILELSPESRAAPQVAARLVALTIVDLARATMTVPLSLPPPRRDPIRKVKKEGAPRMAMGFLGRVGAGSNADRPHFDLGLDGSVRLLSTLRGVLGVGVAFTLPADVANARLGVTMLSLRGGLGWSPGALPALELRLAAVVRPLWLSGDAGADVLEHQGVLAGAALATLYGIRLTGRLDFTVGAGAEAYFNRIAYSVRGSPALATERLAFWAGLGLRVRLL
jgi:hypothetical protein